MVVIKQRLNDKYQSQRCKRERMIGPAYMFLCLKSENFWKLWLTRAESGFSKNRLPRARFSHFQKS